MQLFLIILSAMANSEDPDQIKLADKVDMDKISDELENWPDQIINLRVLSSGLLKKPLFDFVVSTTLSVLIGSP